MQGPHYSQPGSYPGHPSQHPPAIGVDPSERRPKRDLFGILDGFPANALIVLGLFFLLIGLTVPGCRRAYASSVDAKARLAMALLDHDLSVLRDQQEREREAERQQALANPMAPPDTATNETRRQTQLATETHRLEGVHDVNDKRRDALEAAASVQGMFAHRIFEWLGRLLLLIGLIAVTSSAEGTRQKVFMVLTVIVLLTSISGLDLNFDLGTRVDTRDHATEVQRE